MKKLNEIFLSIADKVSYFMGTPINIIFWIIVIGVWTALFGFHVLSETVSLFPSWVTSNAFNFPLNTGTSVAELYIGFLVAAAANRSERANKKLAKENFELNQKIEHMMEQQDEILTKLIDYQEKEIIEEEIIIEEVKKHR